MTKKIQKNNIVDNALMPTPNLGRDYMNRKAEATKIAAFEKEQARKEKNKWKGFNWGVGVGK